MTTPPKDAPVTEAGREPTLDELWAVVSASMAIADEHRLAIYRSGDGVPGPEALAGIDKHIAAGLAARVMYERLRVASSDDVAGSGPRLDHDPDDCPTCNLGPDDVAGSGERPRMMTPFEKAAAIERDRRDEEWSDEWSDERKADAYFMACYDRRGLLNELGWRAAPTTEAPSKDAPE